MDTNIELGNYVSGGYFITKFTDGTRYNRWMGKELLPAKILSVSPCVAGDLPVLSWARANSQECDLYGISPDNIPILNEWGNALERAGEIGYPSVFYKLETARQYIERFVTDFEDIALVGIGLHRSRVENFLAPPQRSDYGVYEAISRRTELIPGEIIGFEIFCYYFGLTHSWHCNGLELHAWDEYQVRANSYGLIDAAENADKIADFAMDDNAEPEIWLPLRIVKYPLA
jgi:hypothetical protein